MTLKATAVVVIIAAITGGAFFRLAISGGHHSLGGQGQARQLSQLRGVAIDAQGNMYVADAGNNRIQKLSPSGRPLNQWGQAGSRPRQFSSAFGIALDKRGNIYVADTGNNRIVKLVGRVPLHRLRLHRR